jgi:hypothetical protein
VSTLQRFLATRQAAGDMLTYEGRQLANPDNVFGNDAGVRQLGAVSGSLDAGLVVALTVPVKA